MKFDASKMRIAIAMSQSPILGRKEYEFAKALYNIGHEVTVIYPDIGGSYDDPGMYHNFINTRIPVEYAYQLHLRLMDKSYSVVLGHSYQSPLYFEAMFGGTPLVIIHEDSYIFDSVESEEVDRSKLWTQHLMTLSTMQAAEKVVVYSNNRAEFLSKSGIRADIITEPVSYSEFGEVNERAGIVIVIEDEAEANKIIESDFGETYEISRKEIVFSSEIIKNKGIFQEAFVALVLCDVPSLDILKYGCSVVKYASDKPSEPLVIYVSPDQGLDALEEGIKIAYKYDKEASGGKQKRIVDFFSGRTYDKIIEGEFGDILKGAIPAAIARGRTRGW